MATWSKVWNNPLPKNIRERLIQQLRFTAPTVKPRTKKGKYPYLQPFFRNRQKQDIIEHGLKKLAA